MDWTTVITAVISAIVAGGSIGGILYYRENRKARQLENEKTASETWRELYEKMEQKHDHLSQKLDAGYKENKMLREENNGLTTQIAVLKLYKCSTLKCIDRQPPFGSKQKQDNE